MSRLILKSNRLTYVDQLHGHQRGEICVLISVFENVSAFRKQEVMMDIMVIWLISLGVALTYQVNCFPQPLSISYRVTIRNL